MIYFIGSIVVVYGAWIAVMSMIGWNNERRVRRFDEKMAKRREKAARRGK